MKNENALTAEYVRTRLDYNPETGRFVWRYKDDYHVQWNAKHVGKTAGTKRRNRETYYWKIAIDGRSYQAHRLAWLYIYGHLPDRQIDHKDLDPLNNSIGNLRLASNCENNRNKTMPRSNTSGFKGVSLYRPYMKWRSNITVNYKQIHLGYFLTKQEAYEAYINAARRYHGEFARSD